MSRPKAIHWFRQDLRIQDNPSLFEASQESSVLPIYILDDANAGEYKRGAASKVWLHHSLDSLGKALDNNLSLYSGDPLSILTKLCNEYDIKAVHWNRCYEPWRIKRDKNIKENLVARGVEVKSHNGSLLWEPWHIQKKDGAPYKVFTPFYRECYKSKEPRASIGKPKAMNLFCDNIHSTTLDELCLLPDRSWGSEMLSDWKIGEKYAHEDLSSFLASGIKNYKIGRDVPSKNSTSRLSPRLHFGELSPNQVWHAARGAGDDNDIDHFCSELGWREFSYQQLFFNPDLPTKNLQTKFDQFPWSKNKERLKAWQQGKTGVPMVDAGMRQLWQTGYMHNRVRMIVGSFLVKNLLINWRDGERWFWDCLIDADLASNSASWQWIAGCGADAAPYFRIFNPVTQGQKFDPEGKYVRKFIPELQELPNKYIFNPWEAPFEILHKAKVSLGKNYPKPIVDLKSSR